MSELKATTAQEIVRNEKDCDYMDELFGGVKMPPTQVYLKAEADAVIAELKKEIESMKVKFRKFNDNVCKKIVDASRTMSAISQNAQMDFYEEFIKDAK